MYIDRVYKSLTLSHKKELLLTQLQPTKDYCVSITTSTSEGKISTSPILVSSKQTVIVSYILLLYIVYESTSFVVVYKIVHNE